MANPRDNKPVLHTKKHIARLERERQQTRWILFGFIGILVLVVGTLGYGYLYKNYLQARRTVAKVGNVSIPVGEWQARVRMERTRLINQISMYQQYQQYFGMDLSSQIQQFTSQLNNPSVIGQNVLDQMIDEELVRQEAAKRGIVLSQQDTDQGIQADFQYFPNGSPTPTITPTSITLPTLSPETLALVTITPTPTLLMTATLTPTSTIVPPGAGTPTATFTPTLTPTLTPTIGPTATATATDTPLPTSTPYTLQGFQDQYNKYEANQVALGLTKDQVRQLFEVNILQQKLYAIITADVPRTQDEIWARHILVADEATANAVRQRLVNGEDFGTLASQVSIDTGTKDKGGDLGWFGKGTMVAEFDAVAFTLKVGEISQPVKSQFGYHIIQVLARGNVPLDATAYSQAQQTFFTNWLTGLRTTYKVQTYNIWQDIVPTDPASPALAQ